MNDNERRVRIAEGSPRIEAGASIECDFNETQLPNLNRPSEPTLRRQIDAWVNEGGAVEKKS